MCEKKYEVLKTFYGYDSFREGQEGLIDSLLAGRDVCGIMPTGAGKSLCYQIPALLLPGISLVVSPLISLMKDQVRALNQMGVHAHLVQGPDLIFHQGDQGGDDQGYAGQQQGRDLIAQGFARAGGHDPTHVPPGQEAVDEPFLAFPEAVVSIKSFQHFIFFLTHRIHTPDFIMDPGSGQDGLA